MIIKFGESGHPGFRARSPLSRGTLKSKGGGKLSIHFFADGDTIETVFRTIISVNQLSNNGAVSDVCEENSTCQTSTGRPVLAEQSDIQEFDSKWDGILLSMTKIPHDDILEGLYTLRIEFWETQDRIGIVWPGDSSEEVRTWLSQIENYGEKKYRARNSK